MTRLRKITALAGHMGHAVCPRFFPRLVERINAGGTDIFASLRAGLVIGDGGTDDSRSPVARDLAHE